MPAFYRRIRRGAVALLQVSLLPRVGLLLAREDGVGGGEAGAGFGEMAQGEVAFGFPQDHFAEAVVCDLLENLVGVGRGLQGGVGLILREAERGERQVRFTEAEGVHLLKEGYRFIEAGFCFGKFALRQIDLGVGVFEHGDSFQNKVLF